jgi:hypothetical protein
VGFCCHPSRREFLRWAGLVAATPLLLSLGERSARATSSAVAPVNLELVTLTETTVVLTWFTGDLSQPPDSFGRLAPAPADTEVWLGTSAQKLRLAYHDSNATPYHYAEITGLEPGQTYFYVAKSNGIPAVPALSGNGSPLGSSTLGLGTSSPGLALSPPVSFTTPHPPPGRHLFSIALCNDLHLGETVAGLATTVPGVGGVPPGISQIDGKAPYAEIMARALSAEARQRGADLLVAAGDISSEAGQMDVNDAKSYLDRFGTYRRDYFVTRGNHDRPHNTAAASACSAVADAPGYHDCFVDAFFMSGPTWFETSINGLRIIGLDTYDKPPPANGGDNGAMSAPQFAWLSERLRSDPDTPTLVAGHHPVTVESDLTTVGKPTMFDLDPQQAIQLEALYAEAPGVFLHHAGHTHRNKRTVSTGAPGVVFQEVAAVKEYPGGFHLLRVFSGGFALNFYKFRDPDAQAWSERSRPEYQGLAPFYTFGNASDRNAVFAHDLTGLRPAGGN